MAYSVSMTYSVSNVRWLPSSLVVMGAVHLALSDRARLAQMARRGWWATADDSESSQALWFAVAGGSLLTMGSLAAQGAGSGWSVPRLAAVSFTATMLAAFTATVSPGAATGVLVGAGMCANAFGPRAR